MYNLANLTEQKEFWIESKADFDAFMRELEECRPDQQANFRGLWVAKKLDKIAENDLLNLRDLVVIYDGLDSKSDVLDTCYHYFTRWIEESAFVDLLDICLKNPETEVIEARVLRGRRKGEVKQLHFDFSMVNMMVRYDPEMT